MEKSIFSENYLVFLKHLREARRQAGLTQEEVARRLGHNQSFVSKCERGERRVDVIELQYFCKAIGVSFEDFVYSLASDIECRNLD
jgi:transcriptional regulator with XRE-family HTH domain